MEGKRSDRIKDYLDYLCAPLLGVVPYAERRSLREEARGHLPEIAAEFEAQGQFEKDCSLFSGVEFSSNSHVLQHIDKRRCVNRI